ncbi:hypothetical protein DUNSADRAFT_6884 [Dunaliella salina]|uniref:Uncharacterized protein n=1 Tax=Dunaliella salina TaxID=3046 RepID=A0ABQ7GMH4_DUNSA|nr:hypothetical protein DUNSADRAFT_6884 [Dunaliella salina]|eukprot:KAF5835795.1 hypothetical protein DUNSADRAFT_6884 [Dunaliella salina]
MCAILSSRRRPFRMMATVCALLSLQDLKNLQEQLVASTSSNRELEGKMKALQEARASALPTPRPVEDRSTLSSPPCHTATIGPDTTRLGSASILATCTQERHPEQRQQGQISGASRLEDAVVRYSGIKPRTPEWLLKLIDGIYRGKIVSDEARAKTVPPQEPIPLVDYMFQHLAGVYGTSVLVNQYAAQLVSTIRANLEVDTRVRLFYHFLMEDRWPRKVLSVFLDGLKRLSEPARLPCCDFPADWSGTKKGGHPLADVRKCLWVADKVLMRRHTRTAYTFAAALALKGEPIHEPELRQYFVAPGYYGQELQHMLEYERGRAEFRKIQVRVFSSEGAHACTLSTFGGVRIGCH